MTLLPWTLGTSAALAWAASRVRYRRARLGPPPEPPPPLASTELRAVTLNAWRLSDPARVPRLIAALAHSGRSLASEAPALPEIFAVQEIESHEALSALREAVASTHRVVACDCSFRRDGSLNSCVAVGLSRQALRIEGSRCIELGRVWPDAERCAIRADVCDASGAPFTIIGAHMAWHVDNAPMSERLVQALPRDRPLLVLGDFNTWPGRRSYRRLVSGPLRDACVGAPTTTPISLRVDLILLSREWRVTRTLNRRSAFEAFGVESFLRWPVIHHALSGRGDPQDCPVSDHLPEGAVIAAVDND